MTEVEALRVAFVALDRMAAAVYSPADRVQIEQAFSLKANDPRSNVVDARPCRPWTSVFDGLESAIS